MTTPGTAARCILVVLALAAAACGRDAPSGAGQRPDEPLAGSGSNAGPNDPVPGAGDRIVAERTCREAIQTVVDSLTKATTLTAPAPGVIEAAACAELYPPPCRDAWTALARHDSDIVTTITVCAAAYCPALAAPKPAACVSATAPRDGDMLEELDRRVLAHLGSSDDVAAALARRVKLFVPITVTGVDIDLPKPPGPPPPGPALTIEIKTDASLIGGMPVDAAELERRVVKAIAADAGTRFVLDVTPDVPYARVYEVIQVIENAGGKSIALQTR